MADFGVLKPKPTSLTHLLVFLLALAFGLVKMCGCYKKYVSIMLEYCIDS